MIIGAIMTLHSVCSATIDKSRSFDISYTKTDDRKKERNLEKKERTSKKASNAVI